MIIHFLKKMDQEGNIIECLESFTQRGRTSSPRQRGLEAAGKV